MFRESDRGMSFYPFLFNPFLSLVLKVSLWTFSLYFITFDVGSVSLHHIDLHCLQHTFWNGCQGKASSWQAAIPPRAHKTVNYPHGDQALSHRSHRGKGELEVLTFPGDNSYKGQVIVVGY